MRRSEETDDPIDFIIMQRLGEPTRLGFVAPTFQIGTVLMADSIKAEDRGCSLSAVRLTSKFELAFPSGSGYLRNTDVHYRVSSERIDDLAIKADANGQIRFSIIPYPGTKREVQPA